MLDYANSSDLDSTNQLTGKILSYFSVRILSISDFYNDVYTRTTHRVRKALFPEILIEDDVNGDDYVMNPSSIVGQFAHPSVLLKEAILNLLSFREQVEDTSNNIAHLIQLLRHSDSVLHFCVIMQFL